ncbi:MAG: hypothetical protein QG549_373 [Patescibacteria group bacterium]|nr:hypothetical protein [Patescibacteria group bacterium]
MFGKRDSNRVHRLRFYKSLNYDKIAEITKPTKMTPKTGVKMGSSIYLLACVLLGWG